MSYSYRVSGGGTFPAALRILNALGIKYDADKVRVPVVGDPSYPEEANGFLIARFTAKRRKWVIEEYVAKRYRWDDGQELVVDIAVYREGKRPALLTEELYEEGLA